MFDWEHGNALHAMQGNWASSHGKGEVSFFFSRCGRNLGYNLKLRRGWSFKARVSSATSALLSSNKGHLRNLQEACRAKRTLLEVRRENHDPFLVATVILGYL